MGRIIRVQLRDFSETFEGAYFGIAGPKQRFHVFPPTDEAAQQEFENLRISVGAGKKPKVQVEIIGDRKARYLPAESTSADGPDSPRSLYDIAMETIKSQPRASYDWIGTERLERLESGVAERELERDPKLRQIVRALLEADTHVHLMGTTNSDRPGSIKFSDCVGYEVFANAQTLQQKGLLDSFQTHNWRWCFTSEVVVLQPDAKPFYRKNTLLRNALRETLQPFANEQRTYTIL